MTYEEAKRELDQIVKKLQSGNLGLEESMQLWGRGEDLVQVCLDFLDTADAKIAEKIGG